MIHNSKARWSNKIRTIIDSGTPHSLHHLPLTLPQVCWMFSKMWIFANLSLRGLIPIIRRALLSSHAKSSTQKAVLCYDRATHIATELWDLGWGCGWVSTYFRKALLAYHIIPTRYRNFLMACAALMDQKIQPMYFDLLDSPIPPGVRHLQQWIENAWANGSYFFLPGHLQSYNTFAGYDAEGASQLKNKLVETRKWIGTAGILTIPSVLHIFLLDNQSSTWLLPRGAFRPYNLLLPSHRYLTSS
jgi:hypothetical protein